MLIEDGQEERVLCSSLGEVPTLPLILRIQANKIGSYTTVKAWVPHSQPMDRIVRTRDAILSQTPTKAF